MHSKESGGPGRGGLTKYPTRKWQINTQMETISAANHDLERAQEAIGTGGGGLSAGKKTVERNLYLRGQMRLVESSILKRVNADGLRDLAFQNLNLRARGKTE